MAAVLLQAKEKERMCEPKHHIRQVKDLRRSIQGPVPRKRKKKLEIRLARSRTAPLNRKSESAHQEDRFVTSFRE